MQSLHAALFLVRKLGFWALLGLAVIFLIGPVLALISILFSFALVAFSTLLPLALVGFAVWLPIRALQQRKILTWSQVRTTGTVLCQKAVVAPVRTGAWVCDGAVHCGQRLRMRCHSLMFWLRGILVEMLSGALVGVLIGAITGFHNSDQPKEVKAAMALGAGIGAVLGILVGVSRLQWVRRSCIDPVPEEPAF